MDEHLYTCLLIDHYGQLLTKRQYEILDMYYNNDYSLAEISQFLNISRQAVSDNKNRAYDSLARYEELLHMVGRYRKLQKEISDVLEQLRSIRSYETDSEIKMMLESAEEKIKTMSQEI